MEWYTESQAYRQKAGSFSDQTFPYHDFSISMKLGRKMVSTINGLFSLVLFV